MQPFQPHHTAVVYEDSTSMKLVTLDPAKHFLQNRKGNFYMNETVGMSSGGQLQNNKCTASVTLLRPTQTLLTDTVPHKTQILYHMDIAQVVQRLNLLPGSIVIESGTGSASLSYSLSQAIGNTGQLHTFEFNEERWNNAKDVLHRQLGVTNTTCYHRDVYADGFTCQVNDTTHQNDYADAVFLDLPKPFDALAHAKRILKRNGRVCCFSPCIEQVQKNCAAMRKLGFIQIKTIESLQRPFQLHDKELFNKYRSVQEKQGEKSVEEKQGEKSVEEKQEDKPKKQIKREQYASSGAVMMKGHTGYLTFGVLF